jgi:hypothetical protein
MRKTLIAILFGTLAFYGCSSESGGGGSAGSAGAGGSAGTGGGAGTGGSAGTGGTAGGGGSAGMGGGGMGGAVACATANAFIKTLDPDTGFMVSSEATEDTTDLPDTWGTFTVSLELTGAVEGHVLQYGFQNNATNFEDTGVFYDNVVINPGMEYEQDFDSLDIGGATIGDDWIFFVNVFDGDGGYKFGYNDPPDPAPNGDRVSALVDNQGGAEQGTQQLSIYSDYTCCQGTNEGHFNGTDLVETNVFRERTVQAADVGNTLTFTFDAKRGNINQDCP